MLETTEVFPLKAEVRAGRASNALEARLKALFVNTGILGHQTVHRLLQQTLEAEPAIDSCHVNLNEGMSLSDRVIRRLLCVRPPESVRRHCHNLDLARWRHEFHCGLLAARKIREQECRRGPFRVIHFHTQAAAYGSLRRMRTTPSIVSIDCTQQLAGQAVSGLERLTYWPNRIHDGCVFRAATVIISTSKWAANDLARHYPDCAGKVNVLPYPVPLTAFDKSWIEERARRHGAGADVPVNVLFMGGDFLRKGGPELLEAWRLGNFARRARLTLATNWPLIAAELPEGVRVVRNVSAYTPAWQRLWREADLFVMPTRSEAFGMVYQEAAAAGVPAVGTRINAVPEIIEPGRTGLLVHVGDVPELIRALGTLVAQPMLRRQMGWAARQRIEKISAPENYAASLLTLIRTVASTRRC